MVSTVALGGTASNIEISKIGHGLMMMTCVCYSDFSDKRLSLNDVLDRWVPEPISDEQAFEAIKQGIDAAGAKVLLNSARFYKKYPEYVDRTVLCVKGGVSPTGSFDSSLENLRRSIDNINAKLENTKRVDIFESARVDSNLSIEEAIKNFKVLIGEGKFDHIGLNECNAETLRRANAVHPIATVEIEVSPWSYEEETRKVIATANELNVTVLAYSPLGRGFLTGQITKVEDIPEGDIRRLYKFPRFLPEVDDHPYYNFNHNLQLVECLKDLASKRGVTAGQLSLAWVRSLGNHVIPIPGSSKNTRTLENMAASDIILTAEDQEEINAVLNKFSVKGESFKFLETGCLSRRQNYGRLFSTSLGVDLRYDGMDTDGLSESQIQVREAIIEICKQFPDDYWMEKEKTETYPHDLHRELAKGGWIGICMPEKYGGSNLGISEATIMLQTISESGGGIMAAQTIHANVYAMQPVWTFATEQQRKRWLPKIISGEERACFAVTEPNSGLDTLSLQTRAERKGDKYIINGSKISAQVAQRMVLLARTTPQETSGVKPSQCLSLFFPRIKEDDGVTLRKGIEMRKIRKMGGRGVDSNEIFFDDFEVPVEDLIGEEGNGFKQFDLIFSGLLCLIWFYRILHGMNAERCLLAGESLGLGYAALRRATRYASERVVFGNPIGKNQSIQHPLAQTWVDLEAGKCLTYNAARAYDELASGVCDRPEKTRVSSRTDLGARCNAAKYFAAEAAFKACERAVMTHGGMGFSNEYHVERYLREIFIPRIAPVSREMVLPSAVLLKIKHHESELELEEVLADATTDLTCPWGRK
ncbi:hypothetical protein Clacol_008799 [Clathrus columnatus]|uniref:Uncharacterized protein n=1 Tax=Clathrus columnatus TaxID=1419009 RepID=A0AAV5AIS7_9AGAM|nr:hypothetical protein Clacol_008799 [Clathrus columnatus]